MSEVDIWQTWRHETRGLCLVVAPNVGTEAGDDSWVMRQLSNDGPLYMHHHAREAGEWTLSKPTIPDVAHLFSAYYARPGNGAWGSLHVVLDDGNADDNSVLWCIGYAIELGDVDGELLARILLLMSKTQRLKIAMVAS